MSVVPPEQSADLRDYYNKHTKTDRLDSKMLARMPMLHPDGLRPIDHTGPADPVQAGGPAPVQYPTAPGGRRHAPRRPAGVAGTGLAGAVRHRVLRQDRAVTVLESYANPNALIKLGRARLTKLIVRASRGHWREDKADEILAAAAETLALWAAGGLDFDELALDIAIEIRQSRTLDAEIAALDDRIEALYEATDPNGIVASAPGVGHHRSRDPGPHR